MCLSTVSKEVFSEVRAGSGQFRVVPIENTTEGVVNHTLDMFIDSNLLIYGEVLQEVSHHLLSKSGLIDEVKKIYSHPACDCAMPELAGNQPPHVPAVEVASTARAADLCADEPSSAAIASELAGQLYGLKVSDPHRRQRQQCDPVSGTVSETVEKTGKDKTSLMLSIKDKCGAL